MRQLASSEPLHTLPATVWQDISSKRRVSKERLCTIGVRDVEKEEEDEEKGKREGKSHYVVLAFKWQRNLHHISFLLLLPPLF